MKIVLFHQQSSMTESLCRMLGINPSFQPPPFNKSYYTNPHWLFIKCWSNNLICFPFFSPLSFSIILTIIFLLHLTINVSVLLVFITCHTLAAIPCHPSADLFSLEIPSINVNLDSLLDEFRVGVPCRSSLAMADSPEGERVIEEESQSTTL